MKTVKALSLFTTISLFATLIPDTAHAGWLDFLKKETSGIQTSGLAGASTALTQDEMIKGLKEALAQGTRQAVSNLGKEGGFLNNLDVKIPMPENLKRVESTLRMLHQDKMADEFIATMNHAAERAVPEAASIFATSISQMSLEDAKSILKGPEDAATQYFRKTSGAQLSEKMLPIVQNATEQTGVTSSYKNLIKSAGPVAQMLGQNPGDIDKYVTDKAMDGLFKMIAAEEKQIRQNPLARSTDLLKKVFGSALQ